MKEYKMIRILVCLGFLTIISCNRQTSSVESKRDETFIDYRNTDNPGICGKWSLCSGSENGFSMQYNICPIVIFKYDGTGTVSNPSLEIENFVWKLKEGNLSILYTTKSTSYTFPDTVYQASFCKPSEEEDLLIIKSKHDYELYLSRNN
jgi:hypothetical protein